MKFYKMKFEAVLAGEAQAVTPNEMTPLLNNDKSSTSVSHLLYMSAALLTNPVLLTANNDKNINASSASSAPLEEITADKEDFSEYPYIQLK